MFSKLSFSIGAALVLCAGTLHAAPAAMYPDESGNPNSIEYRDRMIARESPSNEEIEAGERGNPDSVGYRDRMVDSISPAGWLALESENPDFT